MMTVVLFGTALTTIWSGERRRAALTRIFGLELGEVDVGVEHWADGGQLDAHGRGCAVRGDAGQRAALQSLAVADSRAGAAGAGHHDRDLAVAEPW